MYTTQLVPIGRSEMARAIALKEKVFSYLTRCIQQKALAEYLARVAMGQVELAGNQ